MANDLLPFLHSDPLAPDTEDQSPAALLERCIQRLTARLRGERRPEQDLGPGRPGWWVLAVGEAYGRDDFAARDACRERLRERVTSRGVRLAEWVWVWDTENRAQVVLATLPTRPRAELVAERFRSRGLSIRITPAI